MRFFYALLVAYWAILLVELIGDKSFYMIASLSLEFSAATIIRAMSVTFAVKMMIAVYLGHILARAPAQYLSLLSAVIFFSSAIAIWAKSSIKAASDPMSNFANGSRKFAPYVSLFCCEWIDAGQISAVALTGQFQLPFAIWLGGTLALMSKGALALTIGVTLKKRISEKRLRFLAAITCTVLGIITMSKILLR